MRRVIAATAVLFLLCAMSQATPLKFYTHLTGTAEIPTNASPAKGTALVTYDPVTQLMRVQVGFSGLLGTVTASHIHCCTAAPFNGTNAGVATTVPTFTGFPGGVHAGTYDHTFDMSLASSYNPTFVAAQGGLANAEAFFTANLGTGREYLNIHTNLFPGGEIRGILVQTVPEPASLSLFGSALIALAATRKRLRK